MLGKAKVGVVILNYKVKDLALKCIDSVQRSSYKDLYIIAVDNNSQDELEEKIKKLKSVIFIQTGQNLGYTGGNNAGIKRALNADCKYILILNPDTEIKNDTIENLLQAAQKSEAGIVGPKIYFSDKKAIWYAGGIFDKANVIGKHRGIDEKDIGQYEEETETDFVTGAAMFVGANVFKTIGMFDERYFLYYEDSDFCFRAKTKGFKIIYTPKAVIYHNNAQSTGLGSSLQDYFITRNRMLFASKFLPLRTRFALFRETLKNLGNPTRRLALFDFLSGRFGRGSFRI